MGVGEIGAGSSGLELDLQNRENFKVYTRERFARATRIAGLQ